jgi:peroxiredoxin family protein
MTAPPDKLSIVVHSGEFDRVHSALVMAAAAAAVNTPVTLFFTQWATRALARPGPDGAPGWHTLAVGHAALSPAELDAQFAARNLATFEQLLEACVSFGVRFLVCESGLIAAGLAFGDLRADVPFEVAGVVSFLRDASPQGASFFI